MTAKDENRFRPPTCYFHGLPGSGAEIAAVRSAPPMDVLPTGDPKAFERWLAECGGDKNVRVVGFSLGAFTALRSAARSNAVAEMVLISPAAPIQMGDVGMMAGAPVFRAAMAGRLPLAALTAAQAIAGRFAARAMLRAMFQGTAPSERALLDDQAFVAAAVAGLRHAFVGGRKAYLATVRAYVRDWRDVLDDVTCPVRIIHGSADTWVPLPMATKLAERLAPYASLEVLGDLGHYGTLHRAMSMIAADGSERAGEVGRQTRRRSRPSR